LFPSPNNPTRCPLKIKIFFKKKVAQAGALLIFVYFLITAQADPLSLTPGTDVMIFNIFAEKFSEKIGVFESKQS
jgi:hypothetical protein